MAVFISYPSPYFSAPPFSPLARCRVPYRTVLGSNYIKDLKAIVGRGGAFTFAPPPGYNTLKDLPPPTYSQPAPGTPPKSSKKTLSDTA